tara:strand:- start:5097 stop:5474 length:378 start_codon:yes stop_codon:yes gene_type:complete
MTRLNIRRFIQAAVNSIPLPDMKLSNITKEVYKSSVRNLVTHMDNCINNFEDEIRFRVLFAPCMHDMNNMYTSKAVTLDEAVLLSESIANYTLLLHKSQLMDDHSNFSIIQEFDGELWEEYDIDL